MNRTARLATLIGLGFGMSWQCAYADYYSDGEQLFRKKDYTNAVNAFAQAFRINPRNANALYYMSLCLEYNGDKRSAAKYYAMTASKFTGTQAGNLALQALSRLAPDYYRKLTGAAAAQTASAPPSTAAQTAATTNQSPAELGTTADVASLPDHATVPFIKKGSLLFVNAYVDNHPIDMIFDTGAEAVVFGKNHLSEFNMRMPEGKASGKSGGVGSSSSIDYWVMHVNMKLGQIDRHNFPIIVHENMTLPLLGQSFFKNFEYTIDYFGADKDRGEIRFSKRGSGSQYAANGYSVPFRKSGNEMIVSVDVEGKKCDMFFDTGANDISFTESQLKALNISIPDDAVAETHGGAAGTAYGRGFQIHRIRLGPIEKDNIHVSVINQMNIPYPLLGQSFFGDWQYTIDNVQNVIRFVRR